MDVYIFAVGFALGAPFGAFIVWFVHQRRLFRPGSGSELGSYSERVVRLANRLGGAQYASNVNSAITLLETESRLEASEAAKLEAFEVEDRARQIVMKSRTTRGAR
jgi:hypothetical protein